MSGTNQAKLGSAAWGGAVLTEVLSSVAEADVIAQVMEAALAKAGLSEVPGDARALGTFVRGPLREALADRVGGYAADAVCNEMARFTEGAPSGVVAKEHERERPQPTLRVIVVSGGRTLADELGKILEGEARMARVANAKDLAAALDAAGVREARTVVILDAAEGVLPMAERAAVAALLRHRGTTRSVVTRSPAGTFDASVTALMATGFRCTLLPEDAEAGEVAEACVALMVLER